MKAYAIELIRPVVFDCGGPPAAASMFARLWAPVSIQLSPVRGRGFAELRQSPRGDGVVIPAGCDVFPIVWASDRIVYTSLRTPDRTHRKV